MLRTLLSLNLIGCPAFLCGKPAAVRPREHAVDAEVFAQLTQCGLQMIKQGQAVNEVGGSSSTASLCVDTVHIAG